MRFRVVMLMASIFMASPSDSFAQYSFEDTQKTIVVKEQTGPVYAYVWGEVPAGPLHETGTGFIHPLFDIYGNTLTEAAPADSPFHRGIFWGWPQGTFGAHDVNLITGDGISKSFERWLDIMAKDKHGLVSLQNAWVLDADGSAGLMETVTMISGPKNLRARWVDLYLKFVNVSTTPIQLTSADSIGGLLIQFDTSRSDFTFDTTGKQLDKDFKSARVQWVDVSSHPSRSARYAGVTVMNDPANAQGTEPEFTFHKPGLLSVSYPEHPTFSIEPGEYFELQYRLYTHMGTSFSHDLPEKFQDYLAEK